MLGTLSRSQFASCGFRRSLSWRNAAQESCRSDFEKPTRILSTARQSALGLEQPFSKSGDSSLGASNASGQSPFALLLFRLRQVRTRISMIFEHDWHLCLKLRAHSSTLISSRALGYAT